MIVTAKSVYNHKRTAVAFAASIGRIQMVTVVAPVAIVLAG